MAMTMRQLPGFDGRRLAHLTALITGGAPNPEDKRASGAGVVYATSLVVRAATPEARAHVPYNIVLIDAAEGFGVDDVIDPRDTRRRLIEIFAQTQARRPNDHPPKHRSIVPI